MRGSGLGQVLASPGALTTRTSSGSASSGLGTRRLERTAPLNPCKQSFVPGPLPPRSSARAVPPTPGAPAADVARAFTASRRRCAFSNHGPAAEACATGPLYAASAATGPQRAGAAATKAAVAAAAQPRCALGEGAREEHEWSKMADHVQVRGAAGEGAAAHRGEWGVRGPRGSAGSGLARPAQPLLEPRATARPGAPGPFPPPGPGAFSIPSHPVPRLWREAGVEGIGPPTRTTVSVPRAMSSRPREASLESSVPLRLGYGGRPPCRLCP